MSGVARAGLRTVAAVVAMTVAGAIAAPVATAEQDVARYTATYNEAPRYPGVHIDWDVPITMSDGAVLKSNVYRPMDAAGTIVDTPLPTIVTLTPYTKLASMLADSAQSIPVLSDAMVDLARRFDILNGTLVSGIGDLVQTLSGGMLRSFTADRKLVQSGYTQVVVDVRGTGFSEGVWQIFGDRETRDTGEVIDWASTQPWSDGNIGMTGVSYSGINQLRIAENHPAALKAIFPVEPGSDLARDTLAPGGGIAIGFIPIWLLAVNVTKWVPDLSSIARGNFDWKWLADRVASPITFIDLALEALFTPSVNAIPPNLAAMLEPNSTVRQSWIGHPDRIDIPTFVVGGWHDIFTNSEPKIYNAIPVSPGKKQLMMGDWYHITPGSGLGDPDSPPDLGALQRAWFDKWLRGVDNGIDGFGPVHLYQQGGSWSSTGQFPRAGVDYRRMYLSAERSGSADSVYDGTLTAAEPTGTDTLTVAPGLATVCSRDSAQGTAGLTSIIDGCAKDSRVAERNALTFSTTPVDAATTISGPVDVHLDTVLDATDGYWSATLNDVAPDGNSTVLTSGQLTASLRAVDESKSTRSANGDYTDPYNILTLETRQPIVPGAPTTLDVGLTATDAVLQPGHRLRVDIFAANFPKAMMVPALLIESQLKPQHLVLDPNSPSFVNVPLSRAIA
ncbi:CocE/NonD family hydrolase [Nocardia sp. NPDC051570]|uniref:CocE/NonD family hydrolase n=1 Tax=Nocardia sp. NPDC051570 TaxID=3364324 RepID=UPI0037A61EAB